MKTNSVEAYVSSLTVVEIRKLGSRYGVKNASKYKRDVLIPIVVEAIIKDQQEKN